MLAENLDVEGGELVALGILDLLVDEVDFDLAAGARFVGDVAQDGLVGDDDGQHAVLEGVVEEDVSEGGRDNALDAEVEERPGGVLARAAAAEVGARHDEDLRVAVDALVQDEVGVFGAVLVAELVEEGAAESGALDGLEELLGDDGVGVDVGAVHGGGDALQDGELGQSGARAAGGGAAGGVGVGLVVGGLVQDAVQLVLGLDVLRFGLDVDLGFDLGQNGAAGDVLTDVGKLADDGGRRGHGGGHQVGAATGTLAAFEVAVGGTGAALLRREDIRVHTQTHGAASLSPLEAGVDENLIEALGLGLLLDQAGTGDDHSALDVGGHLLALDDLGGGAQIFDTGVGAGPDENLVHLDILHGRAGRQTHVLEGTLAGKLAVLVLEVVGARNHAGDRDDILGRSTPGDGGDDVFTLEQDRGVVVSTFVGRQAGPVVDSLLPLCAVGLGRQGAALEVVEGDLIRCDHASTRTRLDGHIAHGHPGFHAEAADDRAAELNHGPRATRRSNHTDDVQDDILARDTGRQFTIDLDAHVLASAGDQGLGREDVLDLAGTDAEGQGTESTMGRGVAVTTHDRRSGQGETLLGADDVDNTLALIAHSKVCETKILHVLLEGGALEAGVVLFDEFVDILEVFPGRGRDVL